MDIKQRLFLLNDIKQDEKAKAAILKICSNDPLYLINAFGMTYDPRKTPADIPFNLYPYQEELILNLKECLETKKPFIVVKARDMGLSWCVMAFFSWCLLFKQSFVGTIGSRKQAEVDDGTISSLLPKISYFISHLPRFLNGGFIDKDHHTSMFIEVPSTGAYIRGECGDNIGRGGRSTMLFTDEFAHVQRSAIIMEAISQNSDCLVLGSTPCGRGNEFARLFFEGKIKKQEFQYALHPDKDEAWLAKQKQIMTEEQVAQELLCSFAKSQKGRVYPQFDFNTHCRPNLFDKDMPVDVSFDFGIADPTVATFWQHTPTEVRLIDYIEKDNTTIDEFMKMVIAKPYKLTKIAYGDPDGSKRDRISGHSAFHYMQTKYGFNVRTKRELVKNGILSVRNLLEKKKLVVDSSLRHAIDCFENYKFPEKETGENEKPLHDWTSHLMDSIRYFVDYNYPINVAKPVASQNIR
jgi:hypothetical protein